MSATMVDVSGRRSLRFLPTRRDLYFVVLWSPLLYWLSCLFGENWFVSPGWLMHVPFAIVHSWRARRVPTKRLLARSWLVPFKVAAWSALVDTVFGMYEKYREGEALLSLQRGDPASVLAVAAYCFLFAAACVALGWLLVLTVGFFLLDDRDSLRG